MAKAKNGIVKIIPDETIIRKIYLLRGEKVMLDRDLAELYGVDTKVLKQAVKRNAKRFPKDFMFTLTQKEFQNLRSQFVTSSWGGIRYLPSAFTEQGVAMLSGVINSPKAIEMNIAIMRAFVETRKLLHSNKKIAEQIKLLFDRIGEHDVQLGAIYNALENLMDEKTEEKVKKIGWEERERIGFKK
ncbi:MAG: ORF6N domain-containing protein [Bacteroidota bacterium]